MRCYKLNVTKASSSYSIPSTVLKKCVFLCKKGRVPASSKIAKPDDPPVVAAIATSRFCQHIEKIHRIPFPKLDSCNDFGTTRS